MAERPLRETLRSWIPPEPPVPLETSRWRPGVLTFGPIGRILLTIGVVLFGWGVLSILGGLNSLTLFLIGVYVFLFAVPVLRAVWRRDRRDATG